MVKNLEKLQLPLQVPLSNLSALVLRESGRSNSQCLIRGEN